MIEFKWDNFGLLVEIPAIGVIGRLEKQGNGQIIYNCFGEINYYDDNLEQILTKMKELQGENNG